MTIQSASIPVGATFSPSGGTARSVLFLENVANGIKCFLDDSPASNLLRKLFFANSRSALPNPALPGGSTAQKVRLEVQVPYTLSSGVVYNNKVATDIWYHPETDSAGRDLLINLAALMATEADFTSFWKTGSLA